MIDVFGSEHAAGGVVDDASKWVHEKLEGFYKPDASGNSSEKPTEVQRAQEAFGRGHQLSPDVAAKVGAAVGLPPATGKEADEKCKAFLPNFVCEGRTPGLGDIPWWVWAMLGTGVVGFGALSYVSYKAAPYVLPIAIPESAPFALAWQQARSSEEKEKVVQDALAALVEARRAQGAAKDFGLSSQEQAVRDTLAALGARREQAGRELRSMVPVRG